MRSVLLLVAISATLHVSLAAATPAPASSPSLQAAEHVLLKDLIVTEVLAKQEEARKRNETPWLSPASVIALFTTILAVVSLSFNFTQARRNRADTLEWKEKDARANRQGKLLDSLTWFEGGVQKRALGLAVVEGHWLSYPELRSTWTSVLLSQAVYIVSKPESALPPHEVENLQRIFALLRKAKTELALSDSVFLPIVRLVGALDTRVTQTEKGDRLTPLDRRPFIEQVMSLAKNYPDILAPGKVESGPFEGNA